MIKIIPTIFVNNKKDLEKQFFALEKEANIFQIDIADGNFVKYKNNIDPNFFKNKKNKLELHLMTKDPLKYFEKWSKIKSVFRVYVPLEILDDVDFSKLNDFCKKQKWELALFASPNTCLKKINKYLDQIKTLMFMGVIPGAQGQKFDKKVLVKIKKVSAQYPKILLALDGGIKIDNLKIILSAGIKNLCIGSAIFGEKDIKKAYKTFTQLTKK